VSLVAVLAHVQRIRRADLVALPAVVAGLLTATFVAIGLDAATSTGWTSTRQAMSSIAPHGDTCGLADNLWIPIPGSIEPLASMKHSSITPQHSSGAGWLSQEANSDGWHRLEEGSTGLLIHGLWFPHQELVVTWGTTARGALRPLGTDVARLARARNATQWILLTDRELPARPAGANVVRFVVRGKTGESRQVVRSVPVTFRRQRLSDLLRERTVRPAVDPFIFEAMPCASLPTLAYGVADVPNLLIEWYGGPNFANHTSPFQGLADVFVTVRVPFDGADMNDRVKIHWAIQDPADAIAPAVRRTTG
jgi:hypothetical protein